MSTIQRRAATAGLFVLSLALLAGPADARLKGDLSCGTDDPAFPCYEDDVVDSADVLILTRYLAGVYGQPLTPEQQAAADVAPTLTGGDGAVDSADLLVLSRLVLLGADADGDGVFEVGASGTKWYFADSDGDGLCDGPDLVIPGVCDGGEQALGTSPTRVDSDGDGLCDGADRGPQSDGTSTCVFGEDLDADGSVAGAETHPARPDTDGDGLCDAAAPGVSSCFGAEDANRNGVREANETSTLSADTDGDTLCEGNVSRFYTSGGMLLCAGREDGTSPILADSDGDGQSDLQEATANVACPDCFAVFVMPDTQFYTSPHNNNATVDGARHLMRMAEYICDNGGANLWREPSTGKLMPIKMVIQLGDLVDVSDEVEWPRISALFDELDACGVPYAVVPGNHDVDVSTWTPSYASGTPLYNKYFAAPCVPSLPGEPAKACETPGNPYFQDPGNPAAIQPRAAWSPPNLCEDPPTCAPPGPGLPNGEWFLGNGDDVEALSRNTLPGETPGPPTAEPGRHRFALLHGPAGRKVLFLGLELGFDLVDLDAPLDVLSRFPNVPTVLFHHQAFLQNASGSFSDGGYGTDTLGAGSITVGEDILRRLLDPNPQIFMTLNGHTGVTATAPYTSPGSGHSVIRLLRNYQGIQQPGTHVHYGSGWNVIMAFDPDAGQIRARAYRIDDDANYRTKWFHDRDPSVAVNLRHLGPLEETRVLDKDLSEPVGGVTIPYPQAP